MSRTLGISRTAVWKRVNRLREQGYRIDSAPSAGYRLVSIPDKLLPGEIQNGLKGRFFGRKIHYLEKVDSTSRLAAEMAREGAPEGTLVVADSQAGGKGRLGRTWISPGDCNLYFSVILRPRILPQGIPQITLMASVSLCESLRRDTSAPVRIKWPNDLWVGTKKVGGILTEMSGDMDRVSHVILGIGINVNMSAGALPAELREKATSLCLETGKTHDRVALLRGILTALENDYGIFCEQGFRPFQLRWKEASMTLGRSVRVRMPHKEISGLAVDLGPEGYLRVRSGNGMVEEVVCGDVTMVENPLENMCEAREGSHK